MSDFLKITASNASTRIADELANAKTTLPWLMAYTGAPVFLIPLLVPLRESLSMLPQLFMNPWLMRYAYRRTFWLLASVLQLVCLMLFPLALFTGNGLASGLIVLLILVLYSLTRSLSSLNSKELAAKTVDKSEQGRLNATTTWVSGLFVLGSGFLLVYLRNNIQTPLSLGILFGMAAIITLLGVIAMSLLKEKQSDTEQHDHIWHKALKDLMSLRSDSDLRMLVLLRGLLFFPIMGAPLLVLQMDVPAAGASMLGSVIIANGLAVTLSAPLWGKLADLSARLCLVASSLVCSSSLLLMLLFMNMSSSLHPYLPLSCLVLLVAGHSGIRIGRKTYVATISDSADRNRMIAVSNSIISILLLLAGIISSIVTSISITAALLLLAMAGTCGTFAALSLKRKTND